MTKDLQNEVLRLRSIMEDAATVSERGHDVSRYLRENSFPEHCTHDWGWNGKRCKKCAIHYNNMPQSYRDDVLMLGQKGPYT